MNNTGAVLEELAAIARKDKGIKQRFLDSRESEDPYREFCKVAQALGYDLTVMDIIDAFFEQSEELFFRVYNVHNS